MCLSVRAALTPPYAQVMQRQYHPCFRNRVLRVRIPPCTPARALQARQAENLPSSGHAQRMSGQNTIPSSNRPGHRPFKAAMRVRSPPGPYFNAERQPIGKALSR